MSSNSEMPDAEVQAHALHMWANYIETRNVILSAADLRNMGHAPPRELDESQHAFVERLRKMASEVMR